MKRKQIKTLDHNRFITKEKLKRFIFPEGDSGMLGKILAIDPSNTGIETTTFRTSNAEFHSFTGVNIEHFFEYKRRIACRF